MPQPHNIRRNRSEPARAPGAAAGAPAPGGTGQEPGEQSLPQFTQTGGAGPASSRTRVIPSLAERLSFVRARVRGCPRGRARCPPPRLRVRAGLRRRWLLDTGTSALEPLRAVAVTSCFSGITPAALPPAAHSKPGEGPFSCQE